MQQPIYECKFCKKKFYKERAFMAHECTQMHRSREIQTIIGQQAYGLYKFWLEKQRRKPPAVEGFVHSAYYSSFIKFSQWSRETSIPDPLKYVELMVNNKVAPALWRRNEAYQMYLEYVDKRSDPYEQVNNSVDTILALSEGLEIPPKDVFDRFKSGEIIELIHQRRLSPWLLFCSSSFKDWMNRLHEGEKKDLLKIIGIDYWAQKLEKSQDVVKNVREIAKALGI